MKTAIPLLLAAVGMAASLAWADEPEAGPPLKGWAAYHKSNRWHAPLSGKFTDRLTLGTRLTPFVLLDDESDAGFLGTISKLDAEEDYFPWKFLVEYQFTPRWGVELTWDQIAVHAVTHAADHHMDGDFELTGPILSAVYHLEKRGRFQPYAELGLAWMVADFDPAKWWSLGYAHESDWILLGSSDEPRNSITREIEMDDAPGVILAAGSRIEITRHWSGDFLLRYMYLKPEAEFTEYRKGMPIPGVGDEGAIPLSNLALGLGATYTF